MNEIVREGVFTLTTIENVSTVNKGNVILFIGNNCYYHALEVFIYDNLINIMIDDKTNEMLLIDSSEVRIPYIIENNTEEIFELSNGWYEYLVKNPNKFKNGYNVKFKTNELGQTIFNMDQKLNTVDFNTVLKIITKKQLDQLKKNGFFISKNK